ncbi:hypothetical protein C8Q76DRAFT_803105 [Earliella scabrosa]|nr:hypothetical protein C8Q76DRAFT_803105 [Earliella scabrosa]
MAGTQQTARRSCGEQAAHIALANPDAGVETTPPEHSVETRRPSKAIMPAQSEALRRSNRLSAKVPVVGMSKPALRTNARAKRKRAPYRQTQVSSPAASTTDGMKIDAGETTVSVQGAAAVGQRFAAVAKDGYCYMCQNGGEILECDMCPRVICRSHSSKIQEMSPEILADVYFQCPSCHILEERSSGERKPYVGLYRNMDEKIPFLTGWLPVPADARRPRHARCNTSPIVIVSLRLSTLNDAGTPARLTHAALQAYYTGEAQSNLVYIDAPYNLTSKRAAQAFKQAVDQAMLTVDAVEGARMLLFIYTHSEARSGNLFYTTHKASARLEDWWNDVIAPSLWHAGTRFHVTLAMLSCGALVSSAVQLRSLKSCAERMNVHTVIAFGASALQVAFTSPFFLAYVHRVYIEGIRADREHLGEMLSSSPYLARHTSVVIMTRIDEVPLQHDVAAPSRLRVEEFIWTHPTIKPWGIRTSCRCNVQTVELWRHCSASSGAKA